MQESKKIYDQLAVVTPVVMALSAAAPIFRGYLCDVDCRWNVISAAVDDRTDEVGILIVRLIIHFLFKTVAVQGLSV